jgi:uncharacterized protein
VLIMMTHPRMDQKMRIAVVGTGIAGLATARLLHSRHDVTVFEAGDHVGGHSNTVRVDLADETHHVDTGFVVFNRRNYPNFTRMLELLGVATQPSNMSFSVSDERSGLEYRATNLQTLFAQRRNLVRPAFYRMLADIVRFHRRGGRLLAEAERHPDLTLSEFIDRERFSRLFVEDFLIPLGAAIWSADPTTYGDFPMVSLAAFLSNHGLLGLRQHPGWRTITGGSTRYVSELAAPLAQRIRLRTPVDKVVRRAEGVEIATDAHGIEEFDAVVLACHSDQALRLLADPSPEESAVLGAIRYQPNHVVLHTDDALLPATRRAWASWNYHVLADRPEAATLTYWMNNLQSLDSQRQLLVTLNRSEAIRPGRVLRSFCYDHPVYDLGTLRAQRRRPHLQGARNTWFAGAYWYWGFHEDGLRSALDVAADFGVSLDDGLAPPRRHVLSSAPATRPPEPVAA